jgi:hypothetical protein
MLPWFQSYLGNSKSDLSSLGTQLPSHDEFELFADPSNRGIPRVAGELSEAIDIINTVVVALCYQVNRANRKFLHSEQSQ